MKTKIYCEVNGVDCQMEDYGMLIDFIALKELKPKQYLFFVFVEDKKVYFDLKNNFLTQF